MLAARYAIGLAMLMFVQPALADNPRKVAIGPGSARGALLLNVAPSPVHQMLLFTREEDGPSGREYWVGIKDRPSKLGDQFLVLTLPPGRYRLDAIYQQMKWVACLHSNTLTVPIEPGRIFYLGTLDTRPTLASIQRNARASNHVKAHLLGQWHFYRSDVLAPVVTGRDLDGLARAEAFVRQQMPKSSASAGLADLRWGPVKSAGPSGRANRCD